MVYLQPGYHRLTNAGFEAGMPSNCCSLPFAVPFTQDVEQERIHIIVQRLVIKEKLAE